MEILKVGGRVVAPPILQTVSDWLDEITNGLWLLSIEKQHPSPSKAQNRLLWAWCLTIAESLQEDHVTITAQQVHDAYCNRFLAVKTPVGIHPGSTRTLTEDEMSVFLTNIQKDAAIRLGIILTNKNN